VFGPDRLALAFVRGDQEVVTVFAGDPVVADLKAGDRVEVGDGDRLRRAEHTLGLGVEGEFGRFEEHGRETEQDSHRIEGRFGDHQVRVFVSVRIGDRQVISHSLDRPELTREEFEQAGDLVDQEVDVGFIRDGEVGLAVAIHVTDGQ
jgi:hypothetical protein